MSVREEDRQRNCPSRGLGIAAAAIGVGVGAALYYYFNKRSENPNDEGSTSSWSFEQSHALFNSNEGDDSYTTISENSTSDISMFETTMHSTSADTNIFNSSNSDDDMDSSDSHDTFSSNSTTSDSDSTESDSNMTYDDLNESAESFQREQLMRLRAIRDFVLSVNDANLATHESELDAEWDVTVSSVDIPSEDRPSSMMTYISGLSALASPRLRKKQSEEEQMAILREKAFRERSWSPEQCTICFDMIAQTQETMALPCTHRFHQQCILPWLQHRQTCPNCRKVAECE